ncbi:MAG: complex I NDUFA9 subunit family protein [Verrucomicrobiota bacterium]
MNVLVTGGTGFVGRELSRQLRNAGHRVHLLARKPESPAVRDQATQLGAKVVPGDVLDPDAMSRACGGMDAVIHLVGIIREIGDQTFENIHVRGTRNAVFGAQDAGLRRFLHMSALGTRPGAPARYHQTKWTAEETVRHSGLGWTIFRPSIIYGPGDEFVNLFAKMSRTLPVMPVIGGGKTRYQPVSVKAVAAAFVGALGHPESVGETYDLCGEETLSLEEIIDQILEVTGRRRAKMVISGANARRLAGFLELFFSRLLRKPAPLTHDQLIMMAEDNLGDGSKAREQFGLKRTTFKEGIAAYLRPV